MNAAMRAFGEGFADSVRLAMVLCYIPIKVARMVLAALTAFVRHEPVTLNSSPPSDE